MRADKTLDALSSQSAWFGPSLRPGKPLNSPEEIAFICPFFVLEGPRPYRFGSDSRGCSRTNTWRFSTFPTQIACLLSKANTVEDKTVEDFEMDNAFRVGNDSQKDEVSEECCRLAEFNFKDQNDPTEQEVQMWVETLKEQKACQ